jgi:urease accessory protein
MRPVAELMQLPPPLPVHVLGAASRSAWQARLRLGVSARQGRSVLTRCEHLGPLRIQKALYPEGAQQAQLLMLHPPGGIAGGDALEIELDVGAGASALLTTPGAGKWYKAGGRVARQRVALRVAEGASLEWLPQEAIVFDHAVCEQRLRLDCAGAARCIGWDVTVLGRHASDERFEHGRWTQCIELFRDGECLWMERSRIDGNDPMLGSIVGWNGLHVNGLLWAVGLTPDEALLDACRAAPVSGRTQLGVTVPQAGLLLARALGDSAEAVRETLTSVWSALRPALLGRAAVPPRIWAT